MVLVGLGHKVLNVILQYIYLHTSRLLRYIISINVYTVLAGMVVRLETHKVFQPIFTKSIRRS